MRLHKPIGIWLLLWPALWGLWIAGDGRPDPRILLDLHRRRRRDALGRLRDQRLRRPRPRPRSRAHPGPPARGRARGAGARRSLLFVALGLVAVWLALQLDPYAQLFAVAGAVLAVTYPWLKRVVHVPQFYLGVAFGWSIPMAFAALTGEVPKIAWLLLTAVVLWAAVYDTMYAMVDREDDERIGVKSTAILFGEADRLIVAVMMRDDAVRALARRRRGRAAATGTAAGSRSPRSSSLRAALADPATRARGLLPCLQQQPLRRPRDLRRARARLSLRAEPVRPRPARPPRPRRAGNRRASALRASASRGRAGRHHVVDDRDARPAAACAAPRTRRAR